VVPFTSSAVAMRMRLKPLKAPANAAKAEPIMNEKSYIRHEFEGEVGPTKRNGEPQSI
jgi:hypothetical protein